MLGMTLCALQKPTVSRLAVNFKTAQYALELMSSYGLDGLDIDPEQDSGKFKTVLKVCRFYLKHHQEAMLGCSDGIRNVADDHQASTSLMAACCQIPV